MLHFPITIVTRFGGKALIVGPDGIAILDIPELNTERVDQLMRGDGSTIGVSGGWLGAFNIQNLPPEDRADRIDEWIGAIDGIGLELWRLFAGRIDSALRERASSQVRASFGYLPVGWVFCR